MRSTSRYQPRMLARSSTSDECWVILPVHNRAATTQRCLKHLHELGVPTWAQVLVMDDGSSDGTAALVQKEFPWARVLHGPGNWWWAGAIRAGMAEAAHHGAEFICWLNDDTLPDANALETLLKLARETAGLCGGVSRTEDDAGMSYGGGFMRQRWPQSIPAPQSAVPQPPVPLEWLHGNMVMLHRQVWQRLGLPKTLGTIHNYADIEYTYAAFQLGIPVLLVPAATALANSNTTASYRSWRDDSLSWQDVWRGFYDPKVWWYLPGLLAFKMRTFGVLGCYDCFFVVTKALLLPLFKALRRWIKNQPLPKD